MDRPRKFGRKIASDKEADAFGAYLFWHLNKSAVVEVSTTAKPQSGYGYYAHVMTAKSFQSVEDRRLALKNVQTPIFILRGQYDNQKWGFTQEYLEIFPNHEMVIVPNAGHVISIEQPEIYVNTIRHFLNN